MDDEQKELIQQFKMTEGWAMLERYLNGRISDCKSQLETCPIDKVESVRSELRAYQSIFIHLDELENETE